MEDDLSNDMDGGGASPKKKSNMTMIIIIVVAAIVLGAGGFFAGKMLSGGDGKDEAATSEEKPGEDKGEVKGDQKSEETKATEEGKSGGEETPVEESTDSSSTEGKSSELKGKSKSGLWPLDPFTVNLNDPFGRRYAEVVVQLEISKKELVTQINENALLKPKIRDEIFMIISAKSYSELNNTAGKVTLKEEIQMRVNEIIKAEYDLEPVIGVYFDKFLIQ